VKRIAIEEHFLSEELTSWLCSRKDYPRAEVTEDANHNRKVRLIYSPDVSTPPTSGMLDLDEGRLRGMDESGIDMQVLSLTANLESLDPSDGIPICKRENDALAKIIQKHPDRFAGLATLAVQAPADAAMELERSVKDLGLKGAIVHPSIRSGEYVDNPKYWAIFEMAEKLAVPIYLHPASPPDMIKAFATYPMLTGSIWGFGADTGLGIMRLIFSGVFDKYPHLKIILGHMGEALPFWLWRIDNRWQRIDATKRRLTKKPSHYFKENIFVTTSGVFSVPPLLCTCLELGSDRILFAVDYPYESNVNAVQFIDTAPICDSDKEKICHLNAEKLLGL
jgi:2,3-dihydroxybenzoate decarboxylase